MIENITFKKSIIAIIIRNNFTAKGIKFFTPATFSQQLGYMNRSKGYEIKPHVHKENQRKI